MKKILLIISLFVVAALAVLAMTKPDWSEHYDVVKKTVSNMVDRELHDNPLTAEYATVGTMSALNMLDDYLSKNLMMQDHTFYTIGLLRYKDMFLPISIGMLGQVHLTVSEENLKEALKMPKIKEMMRSNNLEEAVRLYMKKR